MWSRLSESTPPLTGGFEMDEQRYQESPRDYAIEMVEECRVDADYLLLACLKWMGHDDVRGMLDANELSPRFES